jgi:hypothetical protein
MNAHVLERTARSIDSGFEGRSLQDGLELTKNITVVLAEISCDAGVAKQLSQIPDKRANGRHRPDAKELQFIVFVPFTD